MKSSHSIFVHFLLSLGLARVPELGVTTQGATREEANKDLREAIQVTFEAITEDAIRQGRVEIKKGQLL